MASGRVRDWMTVNVITVPATASVEEAALLMHRHHLSGLPVISADSRVVGMVSEKDIVRCAAEGGAISSVPALLYLLAEKEESTDVPALRQARSRIRRILVEQIMSKPPITIEADAPLSEAALLMNQHHINRIPVPCSTRL